MIFIAADEQDIRIPRLHKFAQIISIIDPEMQDDIVHLYDKDDELEIEWWSNEARDRNISSGKVSEVWKLLGGKEVKNITDDDVLEQVRNDEFN